MVCGKQQHQQNRETRKRRGRRVLELDKMVNSHLGGFALEEWTDGVVASCSEPSAPSDSTASGIGVNEPPPDPARPSGLQGIAMRSRGA